MPPPPSIRSLHSWWSDSNSIGATIDLHAVAKPLMGLLFHRQTRNFIRENAGIPLSNANVDIFLSYLAFKYAFPRTKRMVLRHLSERAASEKDAHTLVKSNIVQSDLLVELLNSPDEETRNGACLIIDQLAMHDLTALEIPIQVNPWRLALKEWPALVRPTSKETRAEKARSDTIDRIIFEDGKRYKRECKVLVLGTSKSGKSTIIKQMKITQGGYDERERTEYRMAIYKNVLDCVGMLARVVRRAGISSLPENAWKHAEVLLMAVPMPGSDDAKSNAEVESGSWITAIHSVDIGVDPVPSADVDTKAQMLGHVSGERRGTSDILAQTHAVSMLNPVLADAVWNIWRSCMEERAADEHLAEFNLTDGSSLRYFFSSIRRIADPAYVPNDEDVLHARTKTKTITETRFFMGNLPIHMFDISGLHSERKKWIHCFESVTSIIFCTALSDYDQVLEEDRRVNRMRESLYLFESVINSRWFLRTSVILFFTKIDVFNNKLPRIPLGCYFPEYTGGNDLQKAVKYILWKYLQENRAKLRVYPHVAQGVAQSKNTNNVRLVYAAVKETILHNALLDSGILRKEDMQLL